jgi:hypothetical protein
MKKTFKSVAMMALLVGLSAGCQKEIEAPKQEGYVANPTFANEVKQTVHYSINDVCQSITITGEAEWHMFLYSMLDLAEQGYTVRIYSNGNETQCGLSKEVVTYTTADKDDAEAWCNTMHSNGYSVSMVYDSVNNVFVCTAERKG